MTAPDLTAVKAMLLDAFVEATWRHDPRQSFGVDSMIAREIHLNRWPGDAGRTVTRDEARALTVRRYGHIMEHVDTDEFAATINALYADHYFRQSIREHTLFGQFGQLREAVMQAFAPSMTALNRLYWRGVIRAAYAMLRAAGAR